MRIRDLPIDNGLAGLVLPVPTLPFAMLVGLVDIFLIGGIGMALGVNPALPVVIAGNVAGSLIIYAVLLCILAGGDPRIWRDPSRLRPILTPDQQTDDHAFNVTRAVLWQNGSVVIGRQAGCLAGLTAAGGLSLRSEGMAVVAFVIVGGTVWLLVSMLVSAPDHAALAPWLDRADDRPAPGQPEAGR